MGMRFEKEIFGELMETIHEVSREDTESLKDTLERANRIFITGAGRAGLMMKCFAMRLMHLGYQVNVVGEIVTTSIQPGDLLVIGSGSGETEGNIILAKRVKAKGIPVILISTNKESTLAQLADITVILKAPTKRPDNTVQTVQPMGNRFEQSLLLYTDMVIMELMEIKHMTTELMRKNHTNLE